MKHVVKSDRTIIKYEKYLHTNKVSCRQFQAKIKFLNEAIVQAEKSIPELQKQLEHMIVELPKWKKDLEVQRKSLSTHLERVITVEEKLRCAHKRATVIRELARLDEELDND